MFFALAAVMKLDPVPPCRAPDTKIGGVRTNADTVLNSILVCFQAAQEAQQEDNVKFQRFFAFILDEALQLGQVRRYVLTLEHLGKDEILLKLQDIGPQVSTNFPLGSHDAAWRAGASRAL